MKAVLLLVSYSLLMLLPDRLTLMFQEDYSKLKGFLTLPCTHHAFSWYCHVLPMLLAGIPMYSLCF